MQCDRATECQQPYPDMFRHVKVTVSPPLSAELLHNDKLTSFRSTDLLKSVIFQHMAIDDPVQLC